MMCLFARAELRLFPVAHSSTVISEHLVGNFWGHASQQQLLWLRFNEASYGGGIADASATVPAGGVATVADASATTTRNGPGDAGKCLLGYWAGYKLERVSGASVAVGTTSVYDMLQVDNCQRTNTPTQRT